MIECVTGNLLEADVEALVNTVNTVGVMGKGIALQFRQAFPANYRAYRKAFERAELEPGRMFVFETGQLSNPRYIINFPTKRHWKGKSRMEDIDLGLKALIDMVKGRGIQSIAIPPLGSGNGGLDWNEVRPRIEAAFAELPDVRVLIYDPEGAPRAGDMKIGTKRPRMTEGRAAILGLLANYAIPGYELSMLEIQKLAYFLQIAGEPLKLEFAKGRYGPYAEQLHFVLQHLEGHFIRGYGDRSRDTTVHLIPGAAEEAIDFLKDHPETLKRFERVAQLIEGFETPWGLELLATVHWLANEEPAIRTDVEVAKQGVIAWNEHKVMAFRPYHVEVAWQQLREQGWI